MISLMLNVPWSVVDVSSDAILRSINPINVTNDRLPANIVITRQHMKRLSLFIGGNASVIPRFAPTNVLQLKLSVDFSNAISKRNVLWRKFLASLPLLGVAK